MSNIYFEILALLILIVANGFFALSEFSIIAARKGRLKQLAREGKKSADRALKLQSKPESFLATVQVGITFVGMLAGVFSGATLVEHIQPVIEKTPVNLIATNSRPLSYLSVAIIISLASIILGELVPKYIALSSPARIASATSGPISLFVRMAFIPVKIITRIARGVIALLGIKYTGKSQAVSEEEINILISEGREKGIFEETEADIINSVFDFTDTTARQAMTPRTNIVGIDNTSDTKKILEIVSNNGYSRFPVYEVSLDNIIGVIYAKDIIRILQNCATININDIIRKPIFVPDSMKLNILLRTFKEKKVHIAFVLDEFGGTAGLITLEDLLEEIVGEIQDEFDTEQKEFVEKSKTLAFASGSLRPDELNDQFGTNLPEDGPETIGALVFEKLGHPAVKGEQVIIENLKFLVLEADGNRLKRLRVEKIRRE